ncbi:Elongator subunit elp4 [Malassezia cuniculi]|uniref:Elongator complex protein 4 n=1 Tax=Malassezia cuniculi TaxID=948313 RepID=A0AAF0F1M5_9BASI|nr:Elongator subunit elp4 [Malassezia cuniculi]
MSAFRRRTPAATGGAQAAPGVRTPSYSSPVPLLSTGIPALDDIMSGGGVLSGSLVVFVPCDQTAASSLAEIGGKSAADLGAAAAAAAAAAADAYTDLFLSYATAQGLVSRHVTAVAGFDTDSFCAALMGTAGDDAAEPPVPQESGKMSIAWRYDQLQRIDAPFQRGDEAFCATFDLSRRIAPSALEQLRKDGTLCHVGGALSDTISTLERIADECRRRAQQGSTPPPVLRISIRALGSPLYSGSSHEITAFLWRLRRLLRALAMPDEGPAVPCVANVSLSSSMLGQHDANLIHRIGHLADGCIGLSSFGARSELRDAFPAYTGALRVFRTPTIGTLTNASLRSSVLRGMGAGMSSGSNARVEGGAGGGENNLAFKVKRKRVAIETLHLDAEGGVSERRTKPPGSGSASVPHIAKAPAKEAATPSASQNVQSAQPAATAANPRRTFALKSLRERGQSAAAKHDF